MLVTKAGKGSLSVGDTCWCSRIQALPSSDAEAGDPT